MSEIEIHHQHADSPDTKRVGILVGVIGILLSAVTISSHRAHTDAVIHRTEANDQWTFYQAKKIRQHVSDVGLSLVSAIAVDEAKRQAVVSDLSASRERYGKEAEGIQATARNKDAETEHSERRALRFDLGEGLLELGLVLCSLYFLARKRFFTLFGLIAAACGTLMGASGYLL